MLLLICNLEIESLLLYVLFFFLTPHLQFLRVVYCRSESNLVLTCKFNVGKNISKWNLISLKFSSDKKSGGDTTDMQSSSTKFPSLCSLESYQAPSLILHCILLSTSPIFKPNGLETSSLNGWRVHYR